MNYLVVVAFYLLLAGGVTLVRIRATRPAKEPRAKRALNYRPRHAWEPDPAEMAQWRQAEIDAWTKML